MLGRASSRALESLGLGAVCCARELAETWPSATVERIEDQWVQWRVALLHFEIGIVVLAAALIWDLQSGCFAPNSCAPESEPGKPPLPLLRQAFRRHQKAMARQDGGQAGPARAADAGERDQTRMRGAVCCTLELASILRSATVERIDGQEVQWRVALLHFEIGIVVLVAALIGDLRSGCVAPDGCAPGSESGKPPLPLLRQGFRRRQRAL
jgi:hypothetical protein